MTDESYTPSTAEQIADIVNESEGLTWHGQVWDAAYAAAQIALAERDALAACFAEVLKLGSFEHGVLDILYADPASILAERDAQKWWEGVSAQWEHRPIGNRIPEALNPYRARAEQDEEPHDSESAKEAE